LATLARMNRVLTSQMLDAAFGERFKGETLTLQRNFSLAPCD